MRDSCVANTLDPIVGVITIITCGPNICIRTKRTCVCTCVSRVHTRLHADEDAVAPRDAAWCTCADASGLMRIERAESPWNPPISQSSADLRACRAYSAAGQTDCICNACENKYLCMWKDAPCHISARIAITGHIHCELILIFRKSFIVAHNLKLYKKWSQKRNKINEWIWIYNLLE